MTKIITGCAKELIQWLSGWNPAGSAMLTATLSHSALLMALSLSKGNVEWAARRCADSSSSSFSCYCSNSARCSNGKVPSAG